MIDRKKSPKFNQVDNICFLPVEQSELINKLKIFSINGGTQEIVKIDFLFKAGNAFNKKPLVASFTNKMLKEGSTKYSSKEIIDNIDQYGAFVDFQCEFDKAVVTLYSLNKYLKQVIPFFKEIICNPAFEEKEFKIMKNNAVEKFKINQEKVAVVAKHKFIHTLFGSKVPYGMTPKEEDYQNLFVADVIDFYHQNYQLGNSKIIVSGKINKEVIEILNDNFGKEVISNDKNIKNDFFIENSKPEKLFIEKENAMQSAISIGRLMPNKCHSDYFGLKMFTTILGGYFGSRLMQNIREDKGYTYGVGSALVSLQKGGYFFISTEVGSDVTNAALIEIYKEIERLRTEEISKNELELVKNYMLGQFLNSCDGAFNMASLYQGVLDYGLDMEYYNQFIASIKKITPKTIKELGVKYFDKESLLEVVVGKF